MDFDSFAKRYPRLFHVTQADAWASIARRGLLSTSAAVQLYGLTGEPRRTIEDKPRPKPVVLDRPGLPRIEIRDQLPLMPLRHEHLEDGLTVAGWCRELNRRVHLFLRLADAMRLAAAYPGQMIHAADTAELLRRHGAELLRRHGNDVYLSAINTGNARRRPTGRGLRTFSPFQEFAGRIAEFTVEWSIPDFADLVERAR